MKSYNYLMKELPGDEIIKLIKNTNELNKINFEHLIFENVFKSKKISNYQKLLLSLK